MLNTQRYLLLSAAAATVSERISLVGIWKRNKIEKFFKKYVVKNFGTKVPLQFKTSENHTLVSMSSSVESAIPHQSPTRIVKF